MRKVILLKKKKKRKEIPFVPVYSVITQEISAPTTFSKLPELVRQNVSVQLCANRQLR